MSKRKPRLPVPRTAPYAQAGTADETEKAFHSAFHLLEAGGCNRDILYKHVKLIWDVQEIKLRLPMPNYRRELEAIHKAEQAVSRLLRDNLVWGLFQRPSPFLPEKEISGIVELYRQKKNPSRPFFTQKNPSSFLLFEEDVERLADLPKTLRALCRLVTVWLGPTWKRGTRPLMRELTPRNLFYYVVLWDLHNYVKLSTGRYHRRELCDLLCYVGENQLNQEFRRAKKLVRQFSPEALEKLLEQATTLARPAKV